MPLHRQHAAWLLGLEGVAFLRYGAGDQRGRRFLEARLTEVGQIVGAIDHEPPLIETGEISVPDGYAIWASTYDQDHNPLFSAEDQTVREFLDQLPIGRVVDVACGTGRHGSYLKGRGHEVFGFDLTFDMLAGGSGPRAQADMRRLPVPDHCADAAVCTLALVHLADLGPAFQEMARVVRPGGTIITSDIHPMSFCLGGAPQAAGRRLPATPHLASEYVQAARAADLEVLACHEPRWGVVDGEGGPLAQQWCPVAAAVAYRDTPAAMVWSFRVRQR
jgi:SAM-dependent methyltransferase